MPSIERPDPPYQQIAAHVRAQILNGQLPDGERIASARQLAETWEVSLATAMRALAALRAEGYTSSIAGVGTVVDTSALHHSAHDRAISVHRTGKIYPAGHYAKISSATLASAPERTADALGISEGDNVIRRQRTTYTPDDAPVSTSVSWFRGDVAEAAPLLLDTGRIKQGTMRYVEEQTGQTVTATHVQHAAGFATEEEAEALGVTTESPVLHSRNRYLDADGTVVEYGESTALPEHWVFYEYTIESSA